MTESAADLTRRLLELMSTARFEEALALYDDDIVLKDLFALPEAIEIVGINQLREIFAPLINSPEIPPFYKNLAVRNLIVHQTSDPSVAIGQWDYITTTDTGEIVNPNIVVVTSREGKIVKSLDYHNHVTRAKAGGSLAELLQLL